MSQEAKIQDFSAEALRAFCATRSVELHDQQHKKALERVLNDILPALRKSIQQVCWDYPDLKYVTKDFESNIPASVWSELDLESRLQPFFLGCKITPHVHPYYLTIAVDWSNQQQMNQ